MTTTIPGSNEWSMKTWAMGPMGYQDVGWSGGVFQWGDGTVWITRTQVADYASERQDGLDEGTSIFELQPGAIGWERIVGDEFADEMRFDDTESGLLVNRWMDDTRVYAIIDGDDTMYLFGDAQLGGTIYEIRKSTRTWKRIVGERRVPMTGGVSFNAGSVDSGDGLTARINVELYQTEPWMDDDFLWWWEIPYIDSGSHEYTSMWLRRASRTSPYGVETVKTFADLTGYQALEINATTGLPNGLNDDVIIQNNQGNQQCVEVDGYLYVFQDNGVDTGAVASNRYAYAAVRRIKLDGGTTFENMIVYVTQVPIWIEGGGTPVTTHSYNYEDGTRNITSGPFPRWKGMAFTAGTEPKYRDGWIYFGGRESYAHWGDGWWSGHNWERINLDKLLLRSDEWPIVYDPTDPSASEIEVLSNGTAYSRSHSRWTTKSDYVAWWKDGDKPIHSALDAGWHMDDDGSILFSHTEFGELWQSWDNTVIQVLAKLQSSTSATYDVSLVFEGQSLMGYSAVAEAHQQTQNIEVNLV